MRKNRIGTHISPSIGMVMKMRVKYGSGVVKYQILYRDHNGNDHTRWSSWVRFDGHQIGDNIPVKSFSIPVVGFSELTEVNGHPQIHPKPMAVGAALTGLGMLGLGYLIGKSSD